jgi:hypothetical protein
MNLILKKQLEGDKRSNKTITPLHFYVTLKLQITFLTLNARQNAVGIFSFWNLYHQIGLVIFF